MDALVPLQGGRLREAFATDVTLEGFVARVGHTVTQQALGVGKGLWAHLHDTKECGLASGLSGLFVFSDFRQTIYICVCAKTIANMSVKKKN